MTYIDWYFQVKQQQREAALQVAKTEAAYVAALLASVKR